MIAAEARAPGLRARAVLRELSGGLGDLGVFLPLTLALAAAGAVSFPVAVAFAGLAHLVTAVRYPVPMAVQPMKAIAAMGIASPAAAAAVPLAGALVGVSMLALAFSGALSRLQRWIPALVVQGVQLGIGLLLITRGAVWIAAFAGPDGWLLIAVSVALLSLGLVMRLPVALLLCAVGGVVAASDMAVPGPASVVGVTASTVLSAWPQALGMLSAQLPITVLNSVVAVVVLSRQLFPDHAQVVTARSVGVTVGGLNLLAPFLGGMPVCHGSGGLAAQYAFGARTRWSIVCLGLLKLAAPVLFGATLVAWAAAFPRSLLGVMVLVAGAELCRHGLRELRSHHDAAVASLIAAAVLAGFALPVVVITSIALCMRHRVAA